MTIALLAIAGGAAGDQYHIDLTNYFANPQTEARSRAQLIDAVRAFGSAAIPQTAAGLRAWLRRYDTLLASSDRHDIYVYLRAEEDDRDITDARADDTLGNLEDGLHARVAVAAKTLGSAKIYALTSRPPLLAYRYLLLSSLAVARHELTPAAAQAVETAVNPMFDSAAASYKRLRASSDSFVSHQDAYAALLIAIANGRNGVARLRGFPDAVDAAYFDRSLTPASVDRTLAAVARSDAYARYRTAQRAAPSPVVSPSPMAVGEVIPSILAAEKRMGDEYATAYAALLDQAQGRLELCNVPHCDVTGFSVGASGSVSAEYYGGFDGSVNSARALSHEAGHAVHRQFMNLHQPIAAYNDGPHFMFESFAIFNELLFLDHLYATATEPKLKAYYLNAFLDDATYQVFRSAAETELEQAIYRGVAAGTIHDAADLSRLSAATLTRYDPSAASDANASLYWARNRLYYTDPLYDVNYLYAGLLALRYFADFERSPDAFARRYVALLKNGFDRPPAELSKQFLGIDLSDEPALVAGATTLIDARSATLAALYAGLH